MKKLSKKEAKGIIKKSLRKLQLTELVRVNIPTLRRQIRSRLGIQLPMSRVEIALKMIELGHAAVPASPTHSELITADLSLPKRTRPNRVVVPTQAMIDNFYASWDWKRLRYDFIKDKKRICGCCGAPPDGVGRIVVDHIKSIRKHWALRLDRNNLQLLCDDCNMGKGSRDETDWRNAG